MRRRDALFTMLSTAVFAGTGCSQGNGKLRIAVIPKGTSHEFWKSVHFGADKAGKEFDVDIEWNGPANATKNTEQRRIVETFIGNRVDGICLAPINKTTAGEVIKAAKTQEIPTVIFDSGVKEEIQKEIVSYVATNNYHGGVMAGEYLAKQMNHEGGVIMLRFQAGSESTEQREQGFLDAMKKHPKIEILSENERLTTSVTKARSISETLLGKPEFQGRLKGVFTVCESNNKGMYLALKAMIDDPDRKLEPGDIKFVAFDSDPRMIEGLKNGIVQGVVLQNPVNMGYQAVKAMVEHLDGKKVEKRIPTGEALATKKNMNEKKMADLLKPQQFEG